MKGKVLINLVILKTLKARNALTAPRELFPPLEKTAKSTMLIATIQASNKFMGSFMNCFGPYPMIFKPNSIVNNMVKNRFN